jgi:hypothetical protein
MIWLTWRQLRTQALVAALVIAAAAVYLLITGTRLRHAYTADLASCHSPNAQDGCFGLLNQLQSDYSGPQYLAEFLVMAAPALIGIFWGAPLIAGELERGTHYMVWNQSVTRARWLAAKLAGTALAALLAAGLLSLLLTWWAGPLDAAAGNRWGTRAFNARDITPLGYALFACALGAALGLLIRRTVPAMAATLAVFIAVQVLVTAVVRPNLLPATTSSVAINRTSMSQAIRFERASTDTGPVEIDLPAPPGSWALSQSPALTGAGRPIPTGRVLNCWRLLFSQAAGGKQGSPDFGPIGACLAPLDLHVDLTYQPVSRYWPMQWIETGLYALLAALLTAGTFWRMRRLRG